MPFLNNVDSKMINMYELLICLTNASDLISPELAHHHQQVAYLAFKIAEKVQLPQHEQRELMLAGLLHDVGAVTLRERLDLIENEPPSAQDHAFRGAKLMQNFAPLKEAADIIRYHHVPWHDGHGGVVHGESVPLSSHILHLADRIAVLIDRGSNIIGQIPEIRQKVIEQRGTVFVPELTDAFLELSVQEYIWLDLVYKPLLYILPEIVSFDTVELDMDGVIELTYIFSKIIDFRSPFTANHTVGVAKTAQRMAELAGFSENECKMMLVAGYLHDLGKLAVGNEVLEKPGKLEPSEFNVIRSHTYYTYRLLQAIHGFETINLWASLHHEKLNGKGYPFHMTGESIPLGSRLMAVADIFTAITEDRPYRKGMADAEVIGVLKTMAENGSICPYSVSLLLDNYDEINAIRREAQRMAGIEYGAFVKSSHYNGANA